MRRDFSQLPHFSWLFTVYHRDISGKELERCVVISPVMLFLPSSTKYVHQFNKPTEVLIILLRYRRLF